MDVRLPDGTIITNVPEGTTQSELMRRVGLMAVPSAAPVKEASFNLGDIAKSFGMGAVGSTKALTDVAGADNVVSSKLGDVSKSIQQSLSPERQAEMERQAARMKAAEESGSFLQEVKAGALNVAEAPLQSAAQAIGSFVPYLPALFAAPAAAAMRLSAGSQAAVRAVAQQAPKVIGTAQGAGAVKGSIYDGVLKAEIEAGADLKLQRKRPMRLSPTSEKTSIKSLLVLALVMLLAPRVWKSCLPKQVGTARLAELLAVLVRLFSRNPFQRLLKAVKSVLLRTSHCSVKAMT